MITSRFSSVRQVAGVAVAALGCYMMSQWVATERAALAKVDRQIASAEDDIRRLDTEIGTRSRMGQLERWNAEVLALQAPRPTQFVANGVQLASLHGHGGGGTLPLDPNVMASKGAIDIVSYQAPPSAPAEAAPAPPPRRVAPAAEPAPVDAPLLRHATFVRPKATQLDADAPAAVEVAYRPAAAKPAAKSLLPDDIGRLAAAEKKVRREDRSQPARRDER